MHLAELLATAGSLSYDKPETEAAPRQAPPSALAKAAALGLAATGVTGAAAGLGAALAFAGKALADRLTRR
jgi:hypothetical protein